MENNPFYSGKDLLLKVSGGSQAAFRQLYDRYRNKIFSISWKIIGAPSAAEDVVQDVFIKLWLKKESLPEIENFEAYLNMMVKNYIFNYLRKVANEKSFLQKLKIKSVQQTTMAWKKFVITNWKVWYRKLLTYCHLSKKKPILSAVLTA